MNCRSRDYPDFESRNSGCSLEDTPKNHPPEFDGTLKGKRIRGDDPGLPRLNPGLNPGWPWPPAKFVVPWAGSLRGRRHRCS